jgi:hypothetical protein
VKKNDSCIQYKNRLMKLWYWKVGGWLYRVVASWKWTHGLLMVTLDLGTGYMGMLILWISIVLYTYNFCTFLNVCHIAIYHLPKNLSILDFFPNSVTAHKVKKLLLVISSINTRPTRVCTGNMTIFKCKDYAFYLLLVYYLLMLIHLHDSSRVSTY